MTGFRDFVSLHPLALFIPVVVASSHSMYVCNRGYCYIKKEPDHLLRQQQQLQSNVPRKQQARAGIDFCTDSHGHVMDCELFEILGADQEDDTNAVECKKGQICEQKAETTTESSRQASTTLYTSSDGEVIELDEQRNESSQQGHVSWKENPLKGKCFDNDSLYSFDCNLVQILDEGLVLIEDLRAGGVFAAQPKSDFSTQPEKLIQNHEPPRTPEVLTGSGPTDPSEDFRTNVFLNLEGI